MKDLTLVLDLSASLSLGLVDHDFNPICHRIREQGTRGEAAHALLEECLAEAGRSPADIADICVGLGPGSFTGIRVCAAMAQGLAFASRLPLYPFSSLAGILTGLGGDSSQASPKRAIAAIAANAGRYFVRREGSDSESLLPAEALLELATPATTLVTSGHIPDRERMRNAFGAMARHEDIADFPRLARLAHAGRPVTDGVLRPNYLQASAAEEKRREAGSLPNRGGGPAATEPGVAPR